jgi:hypothetical protein
VEGRFTLDRDLGRFLPVLWEVIKVINTRRAAL